MRSFLSEVVSSLYGRFGDDVSSLNVVMPSRRAGLFFADALSEVALRPLWQPKMVSVGELMESIAGIRSSDPIRLVTELYKVYSRYHSETFDSFYFWGGMLLADFDQIDKYMVDASMLFANIGDLREFDDRSYLNEEQAAIVARFWRNFSAGEGSSQEKERFLAIWKTLPVIYLEFKESLLAQGLAYEGMVHRIAAEKISSSGDSLPDLADARYVIVGFNALSECEKKLFGWLEKSGRAEFFWDYDQYYADNPDNEAGLFLRDNLKRFPALHPDDISPGHFAKSKDIAAVSAPSDSMQCKYVYTFLQELLDKGLKPGKETAIVLTDETLLLPVLHSIPEGVESVNVTMGYPLRQTTAYSFLERLLSLQSRKKAAKNGTPLFYHGDVTGLLNHPYLQESARTEADRIIAAIGRSGRAYVSPDIFTGEEQRGGVAASETGTAVEIEAKAVAEISPESSTKAVLRSVFKSVSSWKEVSGYLRDVLSEIGGRKAAGESTLRRRELFSLIIENIYKVENSLDAGELEIDSGVFASLVRRVLQGLRIPYQGEPLQGIQVMGILETRNVDFENVLILSAGDDNFPGNAAVSSSFIPYNLRYGYGLPTPQHHDGVYAYYFYRLVQRASTVHMAYSSLSDDKHSGEPSRYIRQLEYESPHWVRKVDIPLSVNLSGVGDSITVEKDGRVIAELQKYLAVKENLVGGNRIGENSTGAGSTAENFTGTGSASIESAIVESSCGGVDSAVNSTGTASANVGSIIAKSNSERALSPTALYSYVECPLKFYFKYIARLAPETEIAEEIDQPLFGTILHKAMERLYEPLVGVPSPAERINDDLSPAVVEMAVEDAIASEYLREKNIPAEDYSGQMMLVKDIICRYINGGILPYDASRSGYIVSVLEHRVACGFEGVRLGGVADRIDLLENGMLRVVDYKTGARNVAFASVESLFSEKPGERSAAVFQTMLYCLMMWHSGGGDSQPALYHVRHMNTPDFSPLLTSGNQPVERFSDYRTQFEERIKHTLAAMFDPAKPFTQCSDASTCRYCDFNVICRRAEGAK